MTFSPWPRAIILVDMNAFFASIEQLDHPEWRGRPVAVTNGKIGTCIITSSYEARAYGIKTGMRLRQAKQLCPSLIQCPARPKRYASVSRDIMQALQVVTPDIEIFSVDEAFLDVTHCQRLHGSPEVMGRLAQQTVFDTVGILCSVGVSSDKTTAKFAAKQHKPNGFTVIPPWETERRLQTVPVTELCGIADGIGGFLAKYGVHYCGDIAKMPISILAKRYGNIGRRIWYMCQGADPEPICTTVAAPKSIGHGKVMPPNTTDPECIKTYLMHMSEKVGARLRRHDLQAQHYFIGLRIKGGWLSTKTRVLRATDDGNHLYQVACEFFDTYWQGQGIHQVQITALDPKMARHQPDLFLTDDHERNELNKTMDNINQRYGEFTVAPARLLGRSNMPNVIAPAWKPDGHRQTV